MVTFWSRVVVTVLSKFWSSSGSDQWYRQAWEQGKYLPGIRGIFSGLPLSSPPYPPPERKVTEKTLHLFVKVEIADAPALFIAEGEESVLPLLTQESNSKSRRGILRRAVFSEDQRKALEKMFQKQKYISKTDRKKLALSLGLKESQSCTDLKSEIGTDGQSSISVRSNTFGGGEAIHRASREILLVDGVASTKCELLSKPNNTDSEIECALSEFAADMKLSNAVDTTEGWDAVQEKLDKLEK
ncbi:hypothetical protein WISP_123647 [Willisornis vidua]|uniref:Homeobox domain-containing protein n=1 Tax=Willisornis vidua TaxID=1566151 RepID=A0ABQ9CRV1_9PASS|nr:hypothetical protein WISP_123647 [Willisornis vidua]